MSDCYYTYDPRQALNPPAERKPDRDTPMPPKTIKEKYSVHVREFCPVCLCRIDQFPEWHYCPMCGQRLTDMEDGRRKRE